jgi:hypothetical protein
MKGPVSYRDRLTFKGTHIGLFSGKEPPVKPGQKKIGSPIPFFRFLRIYLVPGEMLYESSN